MKPRLLALLLWIPLSIAAAQDSSKVIAMENAWNQAELKNDASAVQLLLAEDFVMTTAEGEIFNKSQIVASIRDKSYQPGCPSVDWHGGARPWQHRRRNRHVLRKRKRQRQIMGAPGRFTDTWMFLDNRWQCIASHFSIKPK